MYQFPKEPKKIRERIKRYERELRKEYQKFGFMHVERGICWGHCICYQAIHYEHPGPKRSQLVAEAFSLQYGG